MNDAKPLLTQFLSDDDIEAFSQATVNAYKACDKFCGDNVVMNTFPPGIELRSNLLNPFVQHALFLLANERDGFHCEFKLNAARNCSHLRLHKGGLSMTAHYLGRKNDRSMARSALNRAALSNKNLPLFPDHCITPDLEHLYIHLYHGGWLLPESIGIAIPTKDQSQISHGMMLEIVKPELTKAEQIREEMAFRLLADLEIQDGDDKKQAG